jgi:hypothetical protein
MKFYLLAVVGILAMTTTNAVEVASLYTAQVPFDQERRDPRAHAYETALAQVIMRVSGPSLLNDADLFEALFPRPSDFVVQFKAGPDETLFVSFDGGAIEDVLQRSGQTFWGGDRPLTLVWIAVDWGRGDRELLAAAEVDPSGDQSRSINRNRLLRERLLNFAENRGLPILFPLLDSEDRSSVSFSDVWGGFDESVLEASRRYDVNSVLIGRVRAGSGQGNRWTYFFGDQQYSWSGEPEIVLSQLSDMLAEEFAIGGNEPVREVMLNVSGVDSVDAYGSVQAKLGAINVIESFSVAAVTGDRLSLRVAAHGGAARLARALRFAGLLEEDRIDYGKNGGEFDGPEAISELNFYYTP